MVLPIKWNGDDEVATFTIGEENPHPDVQRLHETQPTARRLRRCKKDCNAASGSILYPSPSEGFMLMIVAPKRTRPRFGEFVMAEELTFADLIRRVCAGDRDAADCLVRDYEPAVRRVARIRLKDARLNRHPSRFDGYLPVGDGRLPQPHGPARRRNST